MKSNLFFPYLNRSRTSLILYLTFLAIATIPLNRTLATTAINESDSLIYPRKQFSLSFGGFLASLKNDVVVGNEQLGLGVSLNVEDAFGLQTSTTVLRGDVEYALGKRKRSIVGFEYFGLFRSASKVLESEIQIDTVVFPIGSELNSHFNLQIFKGDFDYAFYMDERIRIGASFGLFIIPISLSTDGKHFSEFKAQVTAPLPVFGLSTDFAITPKLRLKQSIEFLYVQFSNFKGVLTDLNVRLEYNPWKHFGFGLGFNSYDLDITITSGSNIKLDFIGTIESSFAGILFYGRYYF